MLQYVAKVGISCFNDTLQRVAVNALVLCCCWKFMAGADSAKLTVQILVDRCAEISRPPLVVQPVVAVFVSKSVCWSQLWQSMWHNQLRQSLDEGSPKATFGVYAGPNYGNARQNQLWQCGITNCGSADGITNYVRA